MSAAVCTCHHAHGVSCPPDPSSLCFCRTVPLLPRVSPHVPLDPGHPTSDPQSSWRRGSGGAGRSGRDQTWKPPLCAFAVQINMTACQGRWLLIARDAPICPFPHQVESQIPSPMRLSERSRLLSLVVRIPPPWSPLPASSCEATEASRPWYPQPHPSRDQAPHRALSLGPARGSLPSS